MAMASNGKNLASLVSKKIALPGGARVQALLAKTCQNTIFTAQAIRAMRKQKDGINTSSEQIRSKVFKGFQRYTSWAGHSKNLAHQKHPLSHIHHCISTYFVVYFNASCGQPPPPPYHHYPDPHINLLPTGLSRAKDLH